MFKTVNLKCTGTYCTLYCTTTGNSALPPAHVPAGIDIVLVDQLSISFHIYLPHLILQVVDLAVEHVLHLSQILLLVLLATMLKYANNYLRTGTFIFYVELWSRRFFGISRKRKRLRLRGQLQLSRTRAVDPGLDPYSFSLLYSKCGSGSRRENFSEKMQGNWY